MTCGTCDGSGVVSEGCRYCLDGRVYGSDGSRRACPACRGTGCEPRECGTCLGAGALDDESDAAESDVAGA